LELSKAAFTKNISFWRLWFCS